MQLSCHFPIGIFRIRRQLLDSTYSAPYKKRNIVDYMRRFPPIIHGKLSRLFFKIARLSATWIAIRIAKISEINLSTHAQQKRILDRDTNIDF